MNGFLLIVILLSVSINSIFIPRGFSYILESRNIQREIEKIQSQESKITMCATVMNLLKSHYDWDDYAQDERDWMVQILIDNNYYDKLFLSISQPTEWRNIEQMKR